MKLQSYLIGCSRWWENPFNECFCKYKRRGPKRRRAQAESLAPKPTVDVVVGQPSNVIKDPKINPNMPKEPPKQVVNKEKSPVKAVASAVILQKSPSKGGKLDVDNFVPGLKNLRETSFLLNRA